MLESDGRQRVVFRGIAKVDKDAALVVATNRSARHDYTILDTVEAADGSRYKYVEYEVYNPESMPTMTAE